MVILMVVMMKLVVVAVVVVVLFVESLQRPRFPDVWFDRGFSKLLCSTSKVDSVVGFSRWVCVSRVN